MVYMSDKRIFKAEERFGGQSNFWLRWNSHLHLGEFGQCDSGRQLEGGKWLHLIGIKVLWSVFQTASLKYSLLPADNEKGRGYTSLLIPTYFCTVFCLLSFLFKGSLDISLNFILLLWKYIEFLAKCPPKTCPLPIWRNECSKTVLEYGLIFALGEYSPLSSSTNFPLYVITIVTIIVKLVKV